MLVVLLPEPLLRQAGLVLFAEERGGGEELRALRRLRRWRLVRAGLALGGVVAGGGLLLFRRGVQAAPARGAAHERAARFRPSHVALRRDAARRDFGLHQSLRRKPTPSDTLHGGELERGSLLRRVGHDEDDREPEAFLNTDRAERVEGGRVYERRREIDGGHGREQVVLLRESDEELVREDGGYALEDQFVRERVGYPREAQPLVDELLRAVRPRPAEQLRSCRPRAVVVLGRLSRWLRKQ
mmetsp:Transcript_1900/g.6958  ORF Transcript_1900/g.6958 Transcript_1900/m.6958 type:complete len:242 (-) Transcript_1900:60-785(-)